MSALQYTSAIAAFVAAGFWLASALVKVPHITMAIRQEDGSWRRPPHEAAFKRQSSLSAVAATAAAISALAQGASIMISN